VLFMHSTRVHEIRCFTRVEHRQGRAMRDAGWRLLAEVVTWGAQTRKFSRSSDFRVS
jgi:hypothetical protein